MLKIGQIRTLARQGNIVVGIGGDAGERAVRASISAAVKGGFARRVVPFSGAANLMSALKKGEIDAAVRGTLGASSAMSELKKRFGLLRIMRSAVMGRNSSQPLWMLAPVGIDEGRTVPERLEVAMLSARLYAELGGLPQVGILARGREEDAGRGDEIRRSLEEGLELCRLVRAQGAQAYHFGIEIERALGQANVIIAPDGVAGNMIFRSAHYLGGMPAYGAPVVNLCDAVFVDTSRAKKDYSGAIALAAALASVQRAR